MRRTLALLSIAALPTTLFGAPASDLREEGRAVYNFRCYYCHGYSGDARTLAATMLATRPRAFSEMNPAELPPARIERAVRQGVAGTAMKAFAGTLREREISAVTAFVHDEFVVRRAPNTRYHTPENGWPAHERYEAAFAFARAELAIDTPDGALSARERAGRSLFLTTCITCHDRGRANDDGPAWQKSAESRGVPR
ncbi:MAG: cytochrome c [Betaproteobacteria bacterium]|nr:cytochrome c [Betaproteobacteria bacterium]